MKKKLVVFDFDGVILDSVAEHKKRYDFVYASFGKKCPAKTIAQWRKWHDSKWERNFTRLGIKGKQLDAAIGRYWHGFEYKKSKPFKGIKKVLEIFAVKYTLAIVSNTKRKAVEDSLSKYGLSKFFVCVEGGNHKSGKIKRLQGVLRKCNEKAENAVIIGDTPADIRAGKALGVKTIGVLYGWSTREKIYKEKPDAIALKPSDIPKLVEKLFNG